MVDSTILRCLCVSWSIHGCWRQPSLGYRAATYDLDIDDAWAGTDAPKVNGGHACIRILRSDCRPRAGHALLSKGAIYLINILTISRCCIARRRASAPARRSIFQGRICLFAVAPVFTARFRRSRTESTRKRAPTLLVLPLYVLFQTIRRRSQFREAWDRIRKGRPHFRDIANPLWLFFILFLLSLVSYSWG